MEKEGRRVLNISSLMLSSNFLANAARVEHEKKAKKDSGFDGVFKKEVKKLNGKSQN